MNWATVLLEHTRSGAAPHVDWLIAQDAAGILPLLSFRVARRLDALPAGTRLDADRTADHRPHYLGWEGAIGDGRGSVRRLATGTVTAWHGDRTSWFVEIEWSSGVTHRVVARASVDVWRLRVDPIGGGG